MGEEAPDTALIPTSQRTILLVEGEEVTAVRVGSDIYVPVNPLCAALGVAPNRQIARIRRDDVMAEHLRPVRVATAGGQQTLQCLHLESIPLFLAGLEPGRVKESLREKLRVYKRWCRQRIWEAFATEMGLVPAATPVTPTPTTGQDSEVLALEQVEQFGLAIATLARQQIAFMQQHHQEMIEVRGALEEHEGRLNRAAEVVRDMRRDVRALQQRLDPANAITEEQASILKATIQAIAHELSRQSAAAGSGQRNFYASLFGELHRRFGVGTYRALRQAQYDDALAWLQEYQQALQAGDAPALDQPDTP